MNKVAIAWFILASVCLAQMQVSPGDVYGLIVDSTGAAVADVTVTATGPDFSRTVVSDNYGQFLFPVLRTHTYSITLGKCGYKTVRIDGIEVLPGRTLNSKILLQEGSSSDLIVRQSEFKEAVWSGRGPNLNGIPVLTPPPDKRSHPAHPCTQTEEVTPGNLTGKLVDSTGAAVADAKVTAVGPEGSKSEVSDENGGYLFPLLRPALYELTIQSDSHKTLKVEHVIVVSSKTITSRIELPSGSPAEVITAPPCFTEVDTRSRSVNLGDMGYDSVPTSKKPAVTGQENGKSQAPAQQLQDPAQPQPRDLSNAARDKCKKQDDCHWDTTKGCTCLIMLDGDGSNVLRIDIQSSTFQRNIADYEFDRLPTGRNIGDIINLP